MSSLSCTASRLPPLATYNGTTTTPRRAPHAAMNRCGSLPGHGCQRSRTAEPCGRCGKDALATCKISRQRLRRMTLAGSSLDALSPDLVTARCGSRCHIV